MPSGTLTPSLLSTADTALRLSEDVPSQGLVRPFGLTRTTARAGAGVDNPADTAVYDPAQQFNVADNGVALVTTELGQLGVTHQDTQADHQHWTDKD